MPLIRLQKHIADLGICSRRKAEELIVAGKIKVNGEVIKVLGTKIDPDKDKLQVDNVQQNLKSSILNHKSYIYIALHKPIDYICSASGEQGQSVLELLTPENNSKNIKITERVYPVGRLDKDSEGLVLLTNDGELTNILTHPRYEHEKEYEVTIGKALSRDAKKILQNRMIIEDEMYQGMKIIKEANLGRRSIITVILKEGKNRQIRKMFGRLGYDVLSLKRIRIVKLTLGNLSVGHWRLVNKKNII